MISVLDERYAKEIADLRDLFGEVAFNHCRLKVEIDWLLALQSEGLFKLSDQGQRLLSEFKVTLPLGDFRKIKNWENKVRHDVKAVEYFLKEQLNTTDESLVEWVHFGLTSEDINNLSYALILRDARRILIEELQKIKEFLKRAAYRYATTPMISRTHGQVASSTTLGKEIANFVTRLDRSLLQLGQVEIFGKINGAVGNFNALSFVFPELNWEKLAKNLIESYGLSFQRYTTQIEPHDWMAELSNFVVQVNVILTGLVRDIWGYSALNYFKITVNPAEVGSSTMPHKVNPIDFENSEGNLGIANALLQHFALKLPISRWQRDLSDSTVLRNWGVALGHSLLAYRNLRYGLHKIVPNLPVIREDLLNHWEILAEPAQMLLRKNGIKDGYELFKQWTRGKKLSRLEIQALIQKLPLSSEDKERLKSLTPENYLGLAANLAKDLWKSS